MTREEVRTRIAEIGIIPAVRLYSESEALFAAEAIVGAGTVSDVETARLCLDAGAGFLTTPGLDLEIADFALKRDVAVLPGALTPSEVMAARKAGADFVKVFPCAQVGGPDHIRALKAPFPQIPLIASGGVDQKNAADYILAGAAALGIGQHLIHQNAIKRRQREWIHELARRYTNMANEARSRQTARSGLSR